MPFWKRDPGTDEVVEMPPPFFLAFRNTTPTGRIEVLIDPDQIGSIDECGAYMADFALHLARALARSGKAKDEHEALVEILDLLQRELTEPTDVPAGSMQN